MEKPTRSRVLVNDPLAPVRISPVRVNGASVSNLGVEILNDAGEWECVSIHSADYNLVPNSEADAVIQQILSESGLHWTIMNEIWTGGRYWARLYMSDNSIEAPSVGDTISLGLRLENSYDGTCQFRFVLMAYVLSCSNGLLSPQNFASYKMRHTMNNDFNTADAVRVLMSGMDQVKALLPKIDILSEIPLTISLLSRVAKETTLPTREWGFIAEELEDASTAWDLMQAVTHRLSHHGRGKAGLHYSEQIGDYFLSRLVDRITA